MIGFIVRYGILAGLIVSGALMWQWLRFGSDGHGDPMASMLYTYLSMLIALTAVFIGVKRYRDQALGGVIRFLPALGLGLSISVVACVFYAASWEISTAINHFDFSTWWTNYMIESAKAKGVTGTELAKVVAEAQDFRVKWANPLYRIANVMLEMAPVGVLVSLISAAILRKPHILPARRAGMA